MKVIPSFFKKLLLKSLKINEYLEQQLNNVTFWMDLVVVQLYILQTRKEHRDALESH